MSVVIIGQKKLVKTLESYTLQNVPKTILFLGPEGSGKTWISVALAEHLEIDYVHVASDVSAEKLIEYYQCPIPKIYIIDLKDVDERQQNKFLKFIEEPSSNMYIALSARSEVGILPTILNRCIKFTLEEYTEEELKEFAWCISCEDPRVFEICKTPGQLNNLPDDNLDEVFTLCDNIVKKLPASNYANTLSLLTKINLKDSPKKIDFNLFFLVLKYVAFDTYKKTKDKLSLQIYLYTTKRLIETYGRPFSKESFMLNYLDGLWRLAH